MNHSILSSFSYAFLLIASCFILSAESCLDESSGNFSTIKCIDAGWERYAGETVDTLDSDNLTFKAGGVGVIVIRDGLKPGQVNEVFYTANCGNFEMINLEGKVVCPMVNGSAVLDKCVNLAEIPYLTISNSSRGVTMSIPKAKPINEVDTP